MVDVSLSSVAAAMVEATIRSFGRLDCACNNAGIGGAQAPMEEVPEETWSKVLSVNLTGIWRCMKYEIPRLLAGGRGGAFRSLSQMSRQRSDG